MNVAKLFIAIIYIFHIFALISDAAITNKSTNNSSFGTQNGNLCKEKQPYVWCIPSNYKREVAPWEYRHLTNTSMPWNYHFDFYLSNVHEINERSQTLRISMYFELKWHEPRLRVNKSATAWRSEDYVSTSMLNSEIFWYPDIDVHGVQKSSRQLFMNDLYGILIYKRQKILYSSRSDVTLSCPMNFNRYPFDSQTCPFRVSGYYDDDEIVDCTCNVDHYFMAEFATTLQYTIEIVKQPLNYRTITNRGRNYTRCGLAIVFTRSKTQLFFQVYLTTGMLVVVSWASFLINPNIVPGRMGLLVTLLLVLVNVFNGSQELISAVN